MSLNVGEGVRRIALAIKIVSYFFVVLLGGFGIVAFQNHGEAILLFGAAFVFAVFGHGLAWIVEGFAKSR